jgi:hypothetical protein
MMPHRLVPHVMYPKENHQFDWLQLICRVADLLGNAQRIYAEQFAHFPGSIKDGFRRMHKFDGKLNLPDKSAS